MNENLSQLFKIAYNHPEARLTDDIWCVIEAKQARILKIQSLLYGFIGVLSLVGFVFISISLKNQLYSSGFFQYISLIFSDGGLLAIYWKEYLLSLADSLPVASLGVAIFLLSSMMISVKRIAHQYKSQLLIN